jgi:acyl carrier protein
LKEQAQNWIQEWFTRRGKAGKTASALPIEVDYFEAGWLSSMEVVEFVTEIENQFGMKFSDRDLQDPRFVTIAGLAELILECSTQSQGHESR